MTVTRGAYAPIPTPLAADGSFDRSALERHLRFLAEGGLDGVLVHGTNGEFPSLTMGERLAAARATAEAATGLLLMLGIGSCALPDVIELVRAARSLGFGSALLPPPFYYRAAPVGGLAAFFLSVLDVAELPVLLYHIPQVTGVPISDELLDAVGGHPSFGGVKDSSGDDRELARFIDRLGGRAYMVGTDRLISRTLAAGGSGSISAAASVVPALVAATHRDSALQEELDEVRGLLESYGLGPAVKAILRHKGFGAYRTRPPLLDLDEDSDRQLLDAFDELVASGR